MFEERVISVDTITKEIGAFPDYEKKMEARIINGHVEVNMSDVYSSLIKEAARCNYYSSDVIYDIDGINKRLNSFDINDEDSFAPILICFRKMGVDGNSYAITRITEASRGMRHGIQFPNDYFSVFAITFEKDSEYFNLGYINIKVVGRYV